MAKEKVLGIDLGTTFSCMSIMEAGKPIVIPMQKAGGQPHRSLHSPKKENDLSGVLPNARRLRIPSGLSSQSSVRWDRLKKSRSTIRTIHPRKSRL